MLYNKYFRRNELKETLRECKYNLYYKIPDYNKEDFINKLAMTD